MSILLYLYFSLQNISSFVCFTVFVFMIPYVIFSAYVVSEGDESAKTLHSKLTKPYAWIAIFALFLSSIPDIKQMSMIFGIPAAIEIAKNPDVQKIPSNILNVINQELEDKIKEHADNKEEK